MLGRLERQERLLLAGGGTNELCDVQASMRVAPVEEVLGRLERQERLLLSGGGTTVISCVMCRPPCEWLL